MGGGPQPPSLGRWGRVSKGRANRNALSLVSFRFLSHTGKEGPPAGGKDLKKENPLWLEKKRIGLFLQQGIIGNGKETGKSLQIVYIDFISLFLYAL